MDTTGLFSEAVFLSFSKIMFRRSMKLLSLMQHIVPCIMTQAVITIAIAGAARRGGGVTILLNKSVLAIAIANRNLRNHTWSQLKLFGLHCIKRSLNCIKRSLHCRRWRGSTATRRRRRSHSSGMRSMRSGRRPRATLALWRS
jgi:hypothetical protein